MLLWLRIQLALGLLERLLRLGGRVQQFHRRLAVLLRCLLPLGGIKLEADDRFAARRTRLPLGRQKRRLGL